MKILLVEDHLDTARVLAKLLKSEGHEVETAPSKATAIGISSQQSFDIVISDIGLPDGTGLELLRELRAIRPIRGVALSGFGMDEDIQRSKDAGFEAHLTKPIDIHQLQSTIRNLASQAQS